MDWNQGWLTPTLFGASTRAYVTISAGLSKRIRQRRMLLLTTKESSTHPCRIDTYCGRTQAWPLYRFVPFDLKQEIFLTGSMEAPKSSVSVTNEGIKTSSLPLTTLYQVCLHFLTHLARTNSQQVSQAEAPYILSPSWFAFIFSHIRAIIWNDQLARRGYNQVSCVGRLLDGFNQDISIETVCSKCPFLDTGLLW
jgi:hypothetical protein